MLTTIDTRQVNVKVIITTREKYSITPIRLKELPELHGLQLIQQKAKEMDLRLDEEQQKELYRVTGGIPAAIIYVIGQISIGYSVQTVLEHIKSATGDIVHFCFQASVQPLIGKPAHYLLMTIAIFSKAPIREAIGAVAGYAKDLITTEEGLVQLQRLSLVTQTEGRYNLLPLTREYALAELSAYSKFEEEARGRWLQWYQNFVQKYGGNALYSQLVI